jgi:1,2-phenylacetyl-CoA epoxidase catalytic subunit
LKLSREDVMGQRIANFDDWKDLFYKWQKDIGFDAALVKDYKFDAIYDAGTSSEIEFGDYKGRKKFEKVLDVPTQDMRDALLHLIFYQGDTEFGSSEQQRKLIDTAPTDYDRQCLLRVMREEQRHGWQMCHVLISHFGESGKLEAAKLLERRAYEGSRLLGAFNKVLDDFIDFLTYTCFIDRDGKYQLTMLHHSSFAPLSRSMGPMLKEEAFHLFTGQSGLSRTVKAGKVPVEILQKYLNKWLPDMTYSARTIPAPPRDSIVGASKADSTKRQRRTHPRTSNGSMKKRGSSTTKKAAKLSSRSIDWFLMGCPNCARPISSSIARSARTLASATASRVTAYPRRSSRST